jgi:outer membrane lipoprotein-sorting protein
MTLRSHATAACLTMLLTAGIAVPGDAFALTAKEIIEKADAATRGNSQMATVDITVKTRRWTRTMSMRSWEIRAQKKSFAEVFFPAKDAGNRFLLIDKNMWQYVPKLQQTVKISPSMMLQSWMGSDFSNDDIVKESSIVVDYTHRLAGSETVEGMKCHKIELIPKPDAAVVWGKIIYFARESDCLPVRAEYYGERNVMKKVMTCSSFRTMHDRIIPCTYRMQTVGKTDQYTLMEMKDVRFNIVIPARTFSLQNLTRR